MKLGLVDCEKHLYDNSITQLEIKINLDVKRDFIFDKYLIFIN